LEDEQYLGGFVLIIGLVAFYFSISMMSRSPLFGVQLIVFSIILTIIGVVVFIRGWKKAKTE
jgi:uncharacterized membrane protein